MRWALVLAALTAVVHAREPTLKEYRYARALAIDLQGRAPTREEVAALERDDFSFDEYIDKLLKGGGYAARLRRIYLDVLRLEDSPAFTYAPPVAVLRRVQILGPDSKPQWLYYRQNQRRKRAETDGELCLSAAEAGFTVLNNQVRGKPIAISQRVLDENTTVVRPWWLYSDWDAPMPMLLAGKVGRNFDPVAQPAPEFVTGPDGHVTVDVRVCREEAQTSDMGTYWTSGRPNPPKAPVTADGKKMQPDEPPPYGRARPLPNDDGYAQKHVGQPLSCRSTLALQQSIDCGCGVGLIGCMPGADANNDPRAFSLPPRTIAGFPPVVAPQPQNVSAWFRYWWGEEAVRFLDKVFGEDRDLRELLTAHYTNVNGPLAHFYRYAAQSDLGGRERQFDMTIESEPLLDPAKLPNITWPMDASTWRFIPDRGAHAAGLITMPIFLTKYASRRARGAALYSAFWCKTFVAGNEMLEPSTEPNLMVRPGCSTCHATLEPVAAYFSRVEEASWAHLADWQFPLRSLACKRNKDGKLPGFCEPFYDVAFSDEQQGLLRGAYASIDHAAAGPVGAAEAFVASPAFARCATERITSSFLGRPVTGDDEAFLSSLTQTLVKAGFHSRALVKAIVTSPIYRRMSAGGK